MARSYFPCVNCVSTDAGKKVERLLRGLEVNRTERGKIEQMSQKQLCNRPFRRTVTLAL